MLLPGSTITCVGLPASGNKNVSCAADTVSVTSCAAPSTTNRTGSGKWNSGVSPSTFCACFTASLRQLVLVVPAILDLELGMPGLEHPLLEEAIGVPAGRLVDGARQIARLDRAAGVLGDVVADRLPEARVAQLGAQHVQHAAALFVQVAIEDVDRLVVDVGDDRPAVAVRVLVEIGLLIAEAIVVGLVAAGDAPSTPARNRWRSLR